MHRPVFDHRYRRPKPVHQFVPTAHFASTCVAFRLRQIILLAPQKLAKYPATYVYRTMCKKPTQKNFKKGTALKRHS